MKKITFICLFSLFFTSFLFAQNTSIGLRLGLNVSSWYLDPSVSGSESLTGANFGAFLTRSIHNNWGITGELNYSMKGSKFTNATSRLNYIEIPVYANYYFTNSDQTFRPKLIFGGYWAYFLETLEGQKNVFESADYGLLLGAGFHYKLGKGGNWLIFDLRYNYGLADIEKSSLSNIQNRNFSVNLGYSFPLGNVK